MTPDSHRSPRVPRRVQRGPDTLNTTLFDSATVDALTVPNRIVMAPMTRSRAASDGTPSALMSTYYAQRASAGLIIAEGTHPTAAGRLGPGVPGLHNDAHRHGWSRVADAVHDAGGRIFVQLMHAGRLAHPSFLPDGLYPVAPSAIGARAAVYTADGRRPAVRPQPLTCAQTLAIVDDFARSAERAMAAGLEGVEIHGANATARSSPAANVSMPSCSTPSATTRTPRPRGENSPPPSKRGASPPGRHVATDDTGADPADPGAPAAR
ncbi:putative oxidoreductase [Rhodococcus opacus B4]|uniref:Putative oxidoreductase n=1 Tax=Rhodococcus opacus (strain B4) TaxID=632772 RepID=C1B6N2_RHOOB|nr:putative oxidoreductase [Rhodococcus opacus B4]